MYAITATITSCGVTKQIPTFFLDENIQGIENSADAEQIAQHIIEPFIPFDEQHVSISAVKLWE